MSAPASISRSVAEQIFGANKAPIEEVLATDFADLAAEVERAVKAIGDAPAKIKDDADFAATGALVNRAKALTKRLDTTRKGETDPLFQSQKGIKAHFDALVEKIDNALKPHLDAADNFTREKAAREKREREAAAQKLRDQEAAERLKAGNAQSSAVAARAEGRAEALAAQADRLESQSMSAADLVRTKISGGGTATAQTRWAFEVTDYNALQATLGPLGPFLNRDDVEKAIRSVVRIQKSNTVLPGVRVFPDTTAAFR